MDDGRNRSGNIADAENGNHEKDDDNQQRQGKPHSSSSSSGHRKSFSGSLSAFLFQRPSNQASDLVGNGSPPTVNAVENVLPKPSGAMAMAVQPKGIRKRKGSLRKSALLGTSKLRAEGREKRSSQLEQVANLGLGEQQLSASMTQNLGVSAYPLNPDSPYDMSTPRPISSVPPPVPMVTHPVHGDPSKISAQSNTSERQPFAAALQRPRTAESTASTTDEEESPTSSPSLLGLPPLPKKTSDSYFPPQPILPRHTTPSTRSSPLASLPPTVPSPPPSEWDYSETRWWGWIILVVTWIVFVVGMGSCFEVWSWAWDVGETPYAPPELEDDPTLPVVGYYPALMVLTTVMAWVWVVVAWVGMKYFKHANIIGDEEAEGRDRGGMV